MNCCTPSTDIEKIAKGWAVAKRCSQEKLETIYGLEGEELESAVQEGRLVLETVCLFVHACIKTGQFKLPLEFWRILHCEFGIVVYPSAMTEQIDIKGVGDDRTFTDAYIGHIAMFGRCNPAHPVPCPFEYLQQPPPVYKKSNDDS